MGLSKYESDIKPVSHNNEIVYNFLSDFKNIGSLFNEYTLAQISQQFPKMRISDFSNDSDCLRFKIESYGEVGLRITERESPKMIKITGEGKIPFELFIWIQVLSVTAYQSKLRVTLHANLNIMMKMLLGKKLEEGVNKIAEVLTKLPFR